jgi:hypothetical protein
MDQLKKSISEILNRKKQQFFRHAFNDDEFNVLWSKTMSFARPLFSYVGEL